MENRRVSYSWQIDMNNRNSSHTLALEMIPAGSRVLELGPAGGYMTAWMQRELDCRVTCIELSKEYARMCEDHAEAVIVGDLDRVDFRRVFAPESFDVLLAADVLEHLADPWRVLSQCRQLINRRGLLVASVPNIGHAAVTLGLLRGSFRYQPCGILDHTHLRFFTRASLTDMCQSAGFQIREIRTTVAKLTEPYPREPLVPTDLAGIPEPVLQYAMTHADAQVRQFVLKAAPIAAHQLLGESKQSMAR